LGSIFEHDLELFLGKLQIDSLAVEFLRYRDGATFIRAHCLEYVNLTFAGAGLSRMQLNSIAHDLEQRARDSLKKRRAPTSAEKAELWNRNYSDRCSYCGASFADWAKEKFLYGDSSRPQPGRPYFVDVMKGRGSRARHFQVEIEHRTALSHGGSNDLDNLVLVCGWCNSVKGDRALAFDSALLASSNGGGQTVQHRWWTLRHLLLNRQCELSDTCTFSVENSEMTVAPRDLHLGISNPSCFVTCCLEHDPMPNSRRMVPTPPA